MDLQKIVIEYLSRSTIGLTAISDDRWHDCSLDYGANKHNCELKMVKQFQPVFVYLWSSAP